MYRALLLPAISNAPCGTREGESFYPFTRGLKPLPEQG